MHLLIVFLQIFTYCLAMWFSMKSFNHCRNKFIAKIENKMEFVGFYTSM